MKGAYVFYVIRETGKVTKNKTQLHLTFWQRWFYSLFWARVYFFTKTLYCELYLASLTDISNSYTLFYYVEVS